MIRNFYTKGFTLIEVIIYLALFALLMFGFLAASFALVEGGGKDNARSLLANEGAFLIAKTRYVLENGAAVSSPVSGATSNTLVVDGVLLDLQQLVSSNLALTGITFYHATSSLDGTSPDSVGAQFTLQLRSQQGRLVTQDFFSTTTLNK